MKEIELTQGKFAIVDDEDYDWLTTCGISWHVNKDSHTYYAVGCKGRKLRFKMHIEILKYYKFNIKNMEIDHKNHNGLDNRKENMRIATHSENRRNSRPDKNSTSKYKGVSISKINSSKWQSFIFINNKLNKIGGFYSEQDAAIAYDIYAKKYFGEFAYLNFPNILSSEISRVQKIIDNPKKWGNSSQYIGVYYNKKENVFISYINVNKSRLLLGRFSTPEDAAKIRNKYILENNLQKNIYKLNIIT